METHFMFDDRGEVMTAIDVDRWEAWLETADLGVARTIVSRDVAVVTTFVPLEEDGEAAATPQPFVTRVFGGMLDGDERRSPSRSDAESTHDNVVEWCRAGESFASDAAAPATE